MADGPRALQPDEWDQLNTLVSTVFRPSMFASYPQLFNEENRANLRVVAEASKVVCHVGMTWRPATLAGCRIDVACVGAVATYEEYRGRGFASAAFQDCCELAAAAGCDLLLVSGGRGLYTRAGCRRVGQDWDFAYEVERGTGGGDRAGGGSSQGTDVPALAAIDAERLADVMALYRSEPVRFLRSRDDWQRAFACRVVMAAASDFWGVFLAGSLVAYIIVHPPRSARHGDPPQVRVVEFAGDRGAISGALPHLLAHYGAQRLRIHVQGGDVPLHVHLSQAGCAGTPGIAWGTLRVLNFPRLMERCRPLLAERLGEDTAWALRFEADDAPGSAAGGFTIRLGTRRLRIPDLGALASYLFARPEVESVPVQGDTDLVALLAAALPLPALWYGINYV